MFYRIVQAKWAATAMDGEGARLFGGRWNPVGVPSVYLAGSRALAALEIVVHAPREVMRLEWRLIEVEVPDQWIEVAKPKNTPSDWQALPSSPGARNFGGKWLQSGALALALPSVVIPEESTLLVNPRNPDAAKLKVSEPKVFRFDPRV